MFYSFQAEIQDFKTKNLQFSFHIITKFFQLVLAGPIDKNENLNKCSMS